MPQTSWAEMESWSRLEFHGYEQKLAVCRQLGTEDYGLS